MTVTIYGLMGVVDEHNGAKFGGFYIARAADLRSSIFACTVAISIGYLKLSWYFNLLDFIHKNSIAIPLEITNKRTQESGIGPPRPGLS
jgi:hypothetical protein